MIFQRKDAGEVVIDEIKKNWLLIETLVKGTMLYRYYLKTLFGFCSQIDKSTYAMSFFTFLR